MFAGRILKSHPKARRIGIYLGLFAGILLLLEICLRVILGLGSPVLYIADPAFGYFPKGGQHLHRFFVDIDTNGFGMRSRPVSEVKTPGEYRILFVGDSVPFGTTYVDQKDIFVEKIASYFDRMHAKPISVMNASAPGWAPSNELGFLKARGLYQADVVVLVYNTKDLVQPFVPYTESPLVPLTNPATAAGELWSRYLLPRLFPARAVVDPGSTGADSDQPSPAAESRVLETIEMTRQYVGSHGARFVILFSPVVTADIGPHQSDWNRALFQLKSWAERQGVPILDMTEIMARQNPKEIYFDGVHLRAAGDRVVADAFIKRFGPELARQQAAP
jgi:hypothetical protein